MKIAIKLFFLVSFLIAEGNYHRCGFIEQSQRIRENEERPELDKSFLTSNGLFSIHYDEVGEHAPTNENGIFDFNYIEEIGIAANTSYDFIMDLMDLEQIILSH